MATKKIITTKRTAPSKVKSTKKQKKMTGFGYLMNTLNKYSPFEKCPNNASFIKSFFDICLNKETINPLINENSRTEDLAYEKYMGRSPNPINPDYAKILYKDLSKNKCEKLINLINNLPEIQKNDLLEDLNEFLYTNNYTKDSVGEYFSDILLTVLNCKSDRIDNLDEIKEIYYKKKIKSKEIKYQINNQTIVPEITGDNLIIIDSNAFSSKKNNNINVYLEKMKLDYDKISNIVYNNANVPFYKLYVCNDVYYIVETVEDNERKYYHETIHNITTKKIIDCPYKKIMLIGTGGLGKSMMIKHLILDAIKNFDRNQILPICVNLRDYRCNNRGVEQLIKDSILKFSKNFYNENYNSFLNSGKILFLFDGLDEIPLEEYNDFIYDFGLFTSINNNNMFIVSSRDMDNIETLYSEFEIFHLSPLSIEQSIMLINKIEYRPDQPKIKQGFINLIEYRNTSLQMDFVENPLLLSIMLLTYGDFGEIPDQLYKFYERAFNVLSKQHDAIKGLSRGYKSNLNILGIEEIFSEFCARTYIDEIFKFDRDSLSKYMKELIFYSKKHFDINDLYYDLSTGLCLLYEDGKDILFAHRSFQEYFAALYFSKQSDVILQKIPGRFNKNNRNSRILTDKFFSMLYNINPKKISHAIFYPFLVDRKSIWQKLNPENEYFGFLQDCYETLNYGDYECISNSSTKYHLLDFIFNILNIKKRTYYDDLPEENEFFDDEYYRIKSKPYYPSEFNFDEEDTDIESENSIPDDYPRELYPPESIGKQYILDISNLYADRDFYYKIYDILNDDKYVLKVQYKSIIEYINNLKEEIDKEKNTDSLFPN